MVDPTLVTAVTPQDLSRLMDGIIAQFTTPAIGVWLIQWLKDSRRVPDWLLSENSTVFVKRLFAVGAALLGGIGVSYTVHGSLTEGGSFALSWPALAAMVSMGYHTCGNLALQELYLKLHQTTAAVTDGKHL